MIEIINKQKRFWVSPKKFKNLLQQLFHEYKLGNPLLTLAFVTDREIKKLNQRFLNRHTPTDVLSFPFKEKTPDGQYYLGDIIISVPTAFRQCLNSPRGLEEELMILTIHGFLHLLGFEHGQGLEEEEEKVRKKFIEDDHGN
ncbi:MAG: rRNA maturation RNase YbeY [Candidatus Aminicenantes bacterium]|nr:rRNA maturation RNase YbeY [Candidatus Aminicenantes bacterium]OQX53030.1 MAG: rRNA maturation RNase YbeY [Candidatus Aminicenantes bacterium 4484_214]RLE00843.1 MAG: rRNA maturation RNase YbeY [Candidatus Aminicenantes bacterium]RLE02332.1 MAG: rRNA maturation RNase YbeY [Candidatus Aminicenantes bacterium]